MSENKEITFETLLAELKDSNFDSLIARQELLIRGWQIHYVIDADLVGNYCFPEGITDARVAKNRSLDDAYIMDEQATLFDLFKTSSPQPQGIIFDEYVSKSKGWSVSLT